MTNYFELFDKRLTAIESSQREIIARLQSTNTDPADEVGGLELAAQVTRLSKDRIYTLVSKRLIPHKKRGNRLTFRRSELLTWLDEGNRAERKGEQVL